MGRFPPPCTGGGGGWRWRRCDGRRAAHRRRRRGRAHERSAGRPRSGGGALDRIEAPDRLDRGPAVAAGTGSAVPTTQVGAGVAPNPLDVGLSGPTSSGSAAPGYRAAGIRPARCHDRRPTVPGSDRGGVRAVRRGVEHDRLRAHPPRRHPAPHGRGAAARPRAPDRPRSLHQRQRSTAGAEVDSAVHKVGSHPVLRLVITKRERPAVRPGPRRRPPGDRRLERRRLGRLWSSNDCANNPTVDLRTLVPGRPVAFALTWGERTTTPGCAQPRTVVPAGSYRLMVRLDDLISPPTPFLRTP